MELKHQLFRNSASTMAQLFVATVVGLVLPPIFVSYLGFETYGIWALLVVVNTYVALLDLGFGSSLVKYTAEAESVGDRDRIVQLMNVCLTAYAGVLLISLSLLALFGEKLMNALLGDSAKQGNPLFVFYSYTLIALAGLISVPFASLLRGLQRYDQSNLVEICAGLISGVSTALLLINGWKLEALVIGAGLAMSVRIAAYMALTRNAYHLFKFRWEGIGQLRAILVDLFRLSPADQSVRLYNAIAQTAIRISINVFAGVAYVGIYDVAKRMVNQISGVSTIVFVPLVPAVSSLAAQKQDARLRELLNRCYLYLSMIGVPLALFMLCFYDPILGAWLRVADTEPISFAARLLLIGATLDMFTGPITTTAVGLGNASVQTIKMGLTAVAAVVLIFVLGSTYGFQGVIAGEFFAMTLAALVSIAVFQKWFKIPVARMILSSVLRTSLAALPILILLALGWFWSRQEPMWLRLPAWGGLFLSGCIAITFMYWLVGLLSSYELDIARKALLPKRS